MKAMTWSIAVFCIIFIAGCTGKKVEIQPDSEALSIDVPKLDISPDPAMYKALTVVKKFGKKTMEHMSYGKYRKSRSAKKDPTFNPYVFYDQYVLDMNEKNYWVTLTFYTAVRAIVKDPRIESLMQSFPEKAMDVKMKTPAGKTYLLSDTNADGVLDFASLAGQKKKSQSAVDIELLKRMQVKYRWILGIVKRYYRL
ncbi:MAG: hypothetical protein KAT17_10760 [Candidatus Aminicenantes bacterium]|nr:hypothetical protein [Candidatus Aminicenantes bacterium]